MQLKGYGAIVLVDMSLLEILTAATLLVLIWYTVETYRLRKAAQAQVESSTLPIVVFQSSKVAATAGWAEWHRLVVRNLGTGPAFNIQFQPIPIGDRVADFQFSRMLAAGEEQSVAICGLRDERTCSDGQHIRGDFYDAESLQAVLQACKERTFTNGLITYSGASGKRFRSTFKIQHDSSNLDSLVYFDGADSI